MLALENVAKILTGGPFTHEPGLIATLKSIAHAFSCRIHRHQYDCTLHFAYYVIAQDSLPSLHQCLGFVESSPADVISFFIRNSCEQSKCLETRLCVHRDQKGVEDLNPGEAWLVFQALGELARRWTNNETREGYQHVLKVTKAIFQSKTLNLEGKKKIQDATERWASWHQPSKQERLLGSSLVEGTDHLVLNGVGEASSSEGTDPLRSNGDLMFVGSKTNERLNGDNVSSATVYDGSAKRPPYSRRRVVSSGDQPNTPRKRPNLTKSSSSSIPKPFRRSTALYVPSATGEVSFPPLQNSRPPHGRALSDCLPMSHPIGHYQVPRKGHSIDALGNRTADAAEYGSWRSQSIPGAFPIYVMEDEVEARKEDRIIASLKADAGPKSQVLPPRPTRQPRLRVILDSELESSDADDGRSLEPFQTPCNDALPTVNLEPETGSSETDDTSSSEILYTPPKKPLVAFCLESTTCPSRPSLSFQKYHSEITSARVVAHSTFAVMKNQLKGKWDLGEGRIYTLCMPDHPGYIKIGRTTQTITKRQDQIQRCIEYKLISANDDDHCPVPNHGRIENLIHAELRNYRRCFPCAICKQRSKLEEFKGGKPRKNSHDCDGLKMHGEWFEIDKVKALEVVARWREWISMGPYCDGALRPREQLRINYYANDTRRMDKMETVDGEDWRWDEFMAFPEWRYWYSWIRHEFFRERLEVSSRSRFDSLCKHWQSNVLFGLGIFLLSGLFFFGAEIFSSVFSSTLALAFGYSVVFGAMGVLYAA